MNFQFKISSTNTNSTPSARKKTSIWVFLKKKIINLFSISHTHAYSDDGTSPELSCSTSIPVLYHQQQQLIDNPPPIPDVPSQSTIQTTIRRTSLQVADTQPNGRAEISPVWTFALSYDRFYVVFFKNPVLNYTISVKSPPHLVLTAVYTMQGEHLTRLAEICGLGPSHIKKSINFERVLYWYWTTIWSGKL
jgi:hypothetical protein